MKLLYATKNAAKLGSMQRRLTQLGIELIGLQDLDVDIPEVEETGNSPLENAKIKAKAYYEAFHMPVFSCDTGLYFDNVEEEDQPGVHVRTMNGRILSDEEMVAYYVNLSKKYHGLTARYKNAICLYLKDGSCYEAMDASMESKPFLITDQSRPIRYKGFPLDSISVDIKTGRHFYNMPEECVDQVAVEDGFLAFFEKNLREKNKGID